MGARVTLVTTGPGTGWTVVHRESDRALGRLTAIAPVDGPTAPAVELEGALDVDARGHGLRDRSRRAGSLASRLDGGRGRAAAIVDVARDRVARTVQIRLAGPPHVGGAGCVIGHGHGYAARAMRLRAPWAFGVAGFIRLERVRNVASQRAALSAGCRAAGVRRSRLRTPAGGFDDEVRFDRLATDPAPSSRAEARCGGRGQDPAREEPGSRSDSEPDQTPSRIRP